LLCRQPDGFFARLSEALHESCGRSGIEYDPVTASIGDRYAHRPVRRLPPGARAKTKDFRRDPSRSDQSR
jgi:hypothetical protein